MQLTLIRHGQTNGNLSNDYSTINCDRLSKFGQEQANLLAEYLKTIPFDRLLISPFIRAVETIHPTLVQLKTKAEIFPELAECCWHEKRESRTPAYRLQKSNDLEEYKDFIFSSNEAIMKPADGETFGEGLQRVYTFYDKLNNFEPDQKIIIITHGYWINEFLNILLKTQAHIPFHHENCGFTDILIINNSIQVMYVNKGFI